MWMWSLKISYTSTHPSWDAISREDGCVTGWSDMSDVGPDVAAGSCWPSEGMSKGGAPASGLWLTAKDWSLEKQDHRWGGLPCREAFWTQKIFGKFDLESILLCKGEDLLKERYVPSELLWGDLTNWACGPHRARRWPVSTSPPLSPWPFPLAAFVSGPVFADSCCISFQTRLQVLLSNVNVCRLLSNQICFCKA